MENIWEEQKATAFEEKFSDVFKGESVPGINVPRHFAFHKY
jgi:hypothetical protein